MNGDSARSAGGVQEEWEDPLMERCLLAILLVFLLLAACLPHDWLLTLSLWWNGLL